VRERRDRERGREREKGRDRDVDVDRDRRGRDYRDARGRDYRDDRGRDYRNRDRDYRDRDRGRDRRDSTVEDAAKLGGAERKPHDWRAELANGSSSSEDFEVSSVLEEDEEEIIERQRKAREELMRKLKVAPPPPSTLVSSAGSPAMRSPSPDDFDPSPVHVQKADGDNGAGSGKTEPDMFSETFVVAQNSASTQGESLGKVDHLTDNWDDADGYYRVRIGEEFENRYKVFGFTGQGVFSNVLRARDSVDSDRPVAIKIIRNNEVMHKLALKEVDILKRLNSKDPKGKYHCVKLYRSFEHKNHLCMVFEHMSMNLREVLNKYGRNAGLNLEAIQSYAHQLLLALTHLHKWKIIHADLKPDNILVSESKATVKLCDFGSAFPTGEVEITPTLVSRFYRAPEIMMGIRYDCSIDMWSLAVSLLELYTGRIAFRGDSNNHMLKEIFEVCGKPFNKYIRPGKFREDHFDTAFNFLYEDVDKVTKANKITSIAAFRGDRKYFSGAASISVKMTKIEQHKLDQFKGLLDVMLVVDHERRISPSRALKHAFITDPFK
jgi:serine/threonine-protein kinase PRP4